MDNQHHRMRALEITNFTPVYPQITCMNCLKFITEKYRCSECKKTYYCSANCQELHWTTHKQVCNTESISKDNLFVIQLPAPVPVFSLTSVILPDQLPRFSFAFINSTITFSTSPDSFCKLEGKTIRVSKYKVAENDNSYCLPVQSGFHSSLKPLYCGICFVCDCKGPVKDGKCGKCEKQIEVRNFNEIEAETEFLINNALINLLFIKNKLPLMKKFKFNEIQQLSDEEFMKMAGSLLKMNVLHHLSLPVLQINMRMLQILSQLTTQPFITFNRILPEISLFSLCYAAFKASLHHFGVCDVTFQTLFLSVKLLNVYTLSELEQVGPPPLQRNYDPEALADKITDGQFYEIQKFAGPLLDSHKQALVFGNELDSMARTLQDEKIVLEVENLIGQIDCRIENLESWLEGDGYSEDQEDLVVYGSQYKGENEGNTGGNKIDVLE